MIPKVIHRMWLDKNINNNMVAPKKYNNYIDTFNKYNPDFHVEFWNTEKVLNLFDKYPIIQKYYDTWINLPHHIQKCDMARYFILYLFGGVYIDMDFNCYKNLSPLLNRELLLIMEPPEHSEIFEAGRKLYNGFIGSIPYHQFWIDWLDYIVESVKESDDVMETTGPLNFGRFWEQSIYRVIPLVDTCDILPLYYCYDDPHCLTRICENRLDKADRKSKNYHKKLGNYASTHWRNGSGWGKEELTEKDLIENITNLSTDTINSTCNNSTFWIVFGVILLLVVIIVGYILIVNKKN